MSGKRNIAPRKPDIFRYHDYVEYLKDWLAYKKAGQSRFSLRSWAKEAGLSAGYLSLVLSRARHLTTGALQKLASQLKLTPSERSFLELLIVLGSSDSQSARQDALDRMKRFGAYRRANPRETETYRYLTQWYYVAIREMTALPDFKLDPHWIQARLKFPVDIGEIKQAMDFLVESGFIEKLADGSVRPPDKNIDCLGGIFRLALSRFHKVMLALAGESFDNTPSERRWLVGHAFAISAARFPEACRLLDTALEKIKALDDGSEARDEVYFAEFALFPLTQKKAGDI